MGEGLLQPMHLIIILTIVLIVFGAGKLPEVGGAVGKGIKEFKQNMNEEIAPPVAAGRAAAVETAPAPAPPPRHVTAARPDDV